MPVNYRFINRVTGEAAPLGDVDVELCKMSEESVDEKHYGWLFLSCRDFGTCALMKFEGYRLSIEDWAKYKEVLIQRERTRQKPDEAWIKNLDLLDAVFAKYEFTAWR